MKNAPKRIKIDWSIAQAEYDSGLSIRELAEKLNVSAGVIDHGVRQGKLRTRNKSEARALCDKQSKGFVQHTAESKAKISEYAKIHSGGYKEGSGRGKKGRYKGQFCDSSWELAFLLYCEANGKTVVRNTEKFPYEFESKSKNYIPDFIVDGKYVEIKGYISEEWEAKKKFFPHELEVLTNAEMKPILEFVESLHGKDFIKLYEA